LILQCSVYTLYLVQIKYTDTSNDYSVFHSLSLHPKTTTGSRPSLHPLLPCCWGWYKALFGSGITISTPVTSSVLTVRFGGAVGAVEGLPWSIILLVKFRKDSSSSRALCRGSAAEALFSAGSIWRSMVAETGMISPHKGGSFRSVLGSKNTEYIVGLMRSPMSTGS